MKGHDDRNLNCSVSCPSGSAEGLDGGRKSSISFEARSTLLGMPFRHVYIAPAEERPVHQHKSEEVDARGLSYSVARSFYFRQSTTTFRRYLRGPQHYCVAIQDNITILIPSFLVILNRFHELFVNILRRSSLASPSRKLLRVGR